MGRGALCLGYLNSDLQKKLLFCLRGVSKSILSKSHRKSFVLISGICFVKTHHSWSLSVPENCLWSKACIRHYTTPKHTWDSRVICTPQRKKFFLTSSCGHVDMEGSAQSGCRRTSVRLVAHLAYSMPCVARHGDLVALRRWEWR